MSASLRRNVDQGFGLIEVIIAMALLGLLAVAVLPMIWTGLAVSSKQSDVAAATQVVAATIDEVRTNPSAECTAMNIGDTEANERIIVTERVDLKVVGVVAGTCPVRPGTVRYEVTVSDADTDEQLATASTLIFLPELTN